MKKIVALSLLLFGFFMFGFAQSESIKTHFSSKSFYQKNHTAYYDMWAWGSGLKKDGTKFMWIASTNTNATFQITCTELLTKNEIAAISNQKDFLKRNYEARNVTRDKKSYITASNDWSFIQNKETANFIGQPYNEFKPNKKGIVGYYIKIILNTGAFKSIEVQGYL
ncbi:MAG: hypothetical protein WCK59_01320 [Candidatus Falkowbacteria bacterium]